jgi:NitT/TauT family transport system substrate-binding protein
MTKRYLLAAFCAFAVGLPAARAAETFNVGEAPFISGGPFYIARDKGYFAKVGLDVHTSSFNDGALAVPALISGELDVSLVTLSAGMFNSVAKGAPLVIILDRGNNTNGRGGGVINVSNEIHAAGLKSGADLAMLKGKKFGVTAVGSVNQYESALAMIKAGLDPRTDVQWVTGVAPPDLGKMLGRNLVDAIDLSYQYGVFADATGLGPLLPDGITTDDGTQTAVYAALKDTIVKRHDAVVRFAMAIMFAAKEFNAAAADPDKYPETVALLAQAAAAGKPELLKSFAPHWTYASEDGMPNVDSIMKMQDFWVDYFHLAEKKTATDQLFDLSIAKEAGTRLAKDHPFGP